MISTMRARLSLSMNLSLAGAVVTLAACGSGAGTSDATPPRPVPQASTASASSSAPASVAPSVDPALPDHVLLPGLTGNLVSAGSDTLNNIMTLAGEEFCRRQPGVRFSIIGKGSTTAPAELIAGRASIGQMARPMQAQELADVTAAWGYPPVCLRVAVDGLAIVVPEANPVPSLTLAQLDAIWSDTRRRGAPVDLTTWGQVGMTGAWADRPIVPYGRNSASAQYGFFKDLVLARGDYRVTYREPPGSGGVTHGVLSEPGGIGYVGPGFVVPGLRAVPIARDADAPAVLPTAVTLGDGSYPIARFLYVYAKVPPDGSADPALLAFLRFLLSQPGQACVLRDGYGPIGATVAAADRALLSPVSP